MEKINQFNLLWQNWTLFHKVKIFFKKKNKNVHVCMFVFETGFVDLEDQNARLAKQLTEKEDMIAQVMGDVSFSFFHVCLCKCFFSFSWCVANSSSTITKQKKRRKFSYVWKVEESWGKVFRSTITHQCSRRKSKSTNRSNCKKLKKKHKHKQ